MELMIVLPVTSLPRASGNFDFRFLNSSVSKISFNSRVSLFLLGTSIPTALLPGIGASILISVVARASAKLSERLNILLTLTPAARLISYEVIVGPLLTPITFASTPKLFSVSCIILMLSLISLPFVLLLLA